MRTQVEFVTPAQARSWLEMNRDNRRLRPYAVANFHECFKRGEWRVTHQGIAFSTSGRLLDGQHRLTFISQLEEGVAVPINVTRDCGDDLFGVIDQGMKRTLVDVSGYSPEFVSTGNFFARLHSTKGTTGLSANFVYPFIEWVIPELQELLTFTPTKARIWSSSPVWAAAVYQMKRGHDSDYVKVSYDSLCRSDIDAMPNGARALLQQRMSGKIVSARSFDLFCRALRAFDSTQTQKIRSIQIIDQSKTIAEVREYIDFLAKKSPAQAGLKVAKPSANSKAARAA